MAPFPDEPVTEPLFEELELERLDTFRPSPHQRAGGAPQRFSWLLVAAGLVGMWASIELVRAEMAWLTDPGAALDCDINPVIGCSTFLDTWQGHLLGVPNALLGIGAFGALVAVGLMFAAGAQVARWMWQTLAAIVIGGLLVVVWLVFQSVVVLGSLCPYCVVTWVVAILVAVHVLARAAQAGHLPVGDRVARALFADRWLLVAGSYAVLLVLATVAFWEKWLLVFGL